jgi:DNA-binding NtrC family response regulator/predicted ArsR family transcriptional regulator
LQPSFSPRFALLALLAFARGPSLSANDVDVAPVATPVRVDGVLDEWPAETTKFLTLARGDPTLPAKDASADVALRFDDDSLYLALKLQDETIVRDTPNFWDADSIDVYLEVGGPGEAPSASGRPVRHRITLLPFNRGRSFGVVTWAGRRVLGPGGLNGVEVAYREESEGSGSYHVEARIPLRPFDVVPTRDRTIGFEIAYRDHDTAGETETEPAERAQLSLSGRTDLSSAAGPLPRLHFVGAPVPPQSSHGTSSSVSRSWGAVAPLLVLLLLWATGKWARRVQRAVQPRFPRWRTVGFFVFATLTLLLVEGVDAVELVETRDAESTLRRRGELLDRALAEFSRAEVAARLRGVDDAALQELLIGRALRVPEGNRFEPLPIRAAGDHGPGTYRSLDPISGVPFEEYGVRVGGTRAGALDAVDSLSVAVEPSARARRVHVALASFLSDRGRDERGQVVDAVSVVVHLTNGSAESNFAKSFTVDDARNDPVGHNVRTWGRARLDSAPRDEPWLAGEVSGKELHHVDHYVVELPLGADGSEPLVTRVDVAPTAAAGATTFWVSGVTLEHGATTPQYQTLPLGSTDHNGFPLAMREGRPAPGELRLGAKPNEATRAVVYGRDGEPPVELLRLRVYYRAEGPVLRALAEPSSLRVRAKLLVTLEGRAEPLEFPLRAGLEIDDAQLYGEPQHPASMTSFLASSFEWRQDRLHYDGYELKLAEAVGAPGPFKVKRVELEQPAGARGAFDVAGLTALVRDEPPPLPRLEYLEAHGAEITLSAAALEPLRDVRFPIGFAIARDGVVTQVGGSLDADVSDGLRGTGVDAAPLDAADPHRVVLRREERAGRSFLTAALDCAFGGGRLRVLLLHERPTLQSWRQARDVTAIAVGLLALPFVLLLLVDALSRISRIRTRLAFLFVLTSLAPLTVLFVVLVNVFDAEQRRIEERRAAEILRQVRERATQLCQLADDHAKRTLRELETLQQIGGSDDTPEAARKRLEAIRKRLDSAVQAFPDREAPVAIVVETTGEGGGVRRIHSAGLEFADPLFDAAHEGLDLSWGTVVFSGSAQSAQRSLKVRVAGRLDERSLGTIRLDASESESLALLAPRLRRGGEEFEGGEPFAFASRDSSLDLATARTAARELDAGRGVFCRGVEAGGTFGFDLIRGARGDAVAVVAAGIGARPVRVDLGGWSVELPWFVLALSAVILGASHFLGSVVTEGVTRPLARLLRGAVEHAERSGLSRATSAGVRDDVEDEVASLDTSFRRLTDELALRGRQQALLIELVTSMGRPGEVGERAWRALECLHQLVGGEALACYLLDPADEALVRVAERRASPGAEFPARLAARLDERDRPLQVGLVGADVFEEKERAQLQAEAAALLLLPLQLAARSLGCVVVRLATTDDPSSSIDPAFVAGVLAQVAAGLESARLETRAIEDPETGLLVHAHFVARLGEEIDRASHNGTPLFLAMVRWRPAGGESREETRRVVATLARELRRATREREIVARAGLFEFEVLLPLGGAERAEELRRGLRERLADPQSLGADAVARLEIASGGFPEDARSADFLLSAVRRRLDAPTEVVVEGAADDAIERFRRRFPEFGFASARMQPILRQLEKVSTSDATVLVLGETGTGKEVAAQLLHRSSARRDGPLVAVHCAALPEKLLESELFGYEKGAFTGADRRRIGRFEQANGGTLFLDEVAEIPLAMQVKLLRVLQERKVQRLGANEEVAIDVRLVAATHQNLERRVADGSFREDLYYRLKVVTLEMPPLRERLEEIPRLVDRFLAAKRAAEPTCRVRGVEPAAIDLLARHPWPGNIRELRNVIERAIVLGDGDFIRKEDVEFVSAASSGAIERSVGSGSSGAAPAAASPGSASATSATATPSSALSSPVAPNGSGASHGARGGRSTHGTALSGRQVELVALLRKFGTITSREFCQKAKLSQRTALRELALLVERGVVIRAGSRRGATYRLRDDGAEAEKPSSTASA